MSAFSMHNLHFFDEEDSFEHNEIVDNNKLNQFKIVEDNEVRLDLEDDREINQSLQNEKNIFSTTIGTLNNEDGEHTEDLSEATFKTKYREVLITKLEANDSTLSEKESVKQVQNEGIDIETDIKRQQTNRPNESKEATKAKYAVKEEKEEEEEVKNDVIIPDNLQSPAINDHEVDKQQKNVLSSNFIKPDVEPDGDSIGTESIDDWMEQSVEEEEVMVIAESSQIQPESITKSINPPEKVHEFTDLTYKLDHSTSKDTERSNEKNDQLNVEKSELNDKRSIQEGENEKKEEKSFKGIESDSESGEIEEHLEIDPYHQEVFEGISDLIQTQLTETTEMLVQLKETTGQHTRVLKSIQKKIENQSNINDSLTTLRQLMLESGNQNSSQQNRLQQTIDDRLQDQTLRISQQFQQWQQTQERQWKEMQDLLTSQLQRVVSKQVKEEQELDVTQSFVDLRKQIDQFEVKLEQIQVHLFNLLDQKHHHKQNDSQIKDNKIVDQLIDLNKQTNNAIEQLNRSIYTETDNLIQMKQSLQDLATKVDSFEKSFKSIVDSPPMAATLQPEKLIEKSIQQNRIVNHSMSVQNGQEKEVKAIQAEEDQSSLWVAESTKDSRLSELDFLDQLNVMVRHFRSAYRTYLDRLKHFKNFSAVQQSQNGNSDLHMQTSAWNQEIQTQLQSMGQYKFQSIDVYGKQRKSHLPNELQQLQRLQRIRHSVNRKMQRLDKTLQTHFKDVN